MHLSSGRYAWYKKILYKANSVQGYTTSGTFGQMNFCIQSVSYSKFSEGGFKNKSLHSKCTMIIC